MSIRLHPLCLVLGRGGGTSLRRGKLGRFGNSRARFCSEERALGFKKIQEIPIKVPCKFWLCVMCCLLERSGGGTAGNTGCGKARGEQSVPDLPQIHPLDGSLEWKEFWKRVWMLCCLVLCWEQVWGQDSPGGVGGSGGLSSVCLRGTSHSVGFFSGQGEGWFGFLEPLRV